MDIIAEVTYGRCCYIDFQILPDYGWVQEIKYTLTDEAIPASLIPYSQF